MSEDEITRLAAEYARRVVSQPHYWRGPQIDPIRPTLQVSKDDLFTDISYEMVQAIKAALGVSDTVKVKK